MSINQEEQNIILGDAMLEITKLPDNSLDMIFTDPPYFIDRLDTTWNANEVVDSSKNKPNSHIKHLPKGMKFDKKQVKQLYEFYHEFAEKAIEKLKPGGFFLSFSAPRLYHAIAMACDCAGFEVRDMINWTYTQNQPKGMSVSHLIEKMDISQEEKEQLKAQYENFKTPQIKSCFEPICVAMKPTEETFLKNEMKFGTGLLDFSQKVGINSDKVPANVMTTEGFSELYDNNFLVSKPTKKEKGDFNTHITVKPVPLLEHIIRIFSKEGATILDPFIGSGTTAIACKNTNRKCIGFELNKEYYDIALKRLKT